MAINFSKIVRFSKKIWLKKARKIIKLIQTKLYPHSRMGSNKHEKALK